MNLFLLTASILAILIGVVHSVLGEKLIFSRLRSTGIVPTEAPLPLKERNIRIIWATWHIVSLFGFGIAFLLYLLAIPSTNIEITWRIKMAIALPMFLSAMLVLWATKGRYPGWTGLLMVSIFVFLS